MRLAHFDRVACVKKYRFGCCVNYLPSISLSHFDPYRSVFVTPSRLARTSANVPGLPGNVYLYHFFM
jgi:hypothetical protein